MNQTKNISVFVTTQEKERIKNLASSLGLSLSAYLRSLALSQSQVYKGVQASA